MAEQVQAVLDSMVTPLRELMDREIFTQEEIQAIVARRRDSEYLLRRRVVRKADGLRYLQDELNLEKLRELRTKNKPKEKKEASDAHIVQHVHFIFTRLLRKFKDDVSLYLQYAEFCKSTNSLKRLGKVYTEALQIHPRNVGLWIEAASHEFFHEGSVASARVLLQRGLRVNASSQDLWLQYFSLELHYLQKLHGRREILQLSTGEEEEDSSVNIPTVVFDNAIQAIADDVTFRLKFLDILSSFPNTEAIEAHIMKSIAKDFGNQPEAWIARAAHAAAAPAPVGGLAMPQQDDEDDETEETAHKRQKLDTKDRVFMLLEEATDIVCTSEMFVASIQFLRSQYGEACHDFVHKLFSKAAQREVVSDDLILQEADVLEEEGNTEKAIDVCRRFATTQKQVKVGVWLLWAKLSSSSSEETASSVLYKALESTPVYSENHLRVMLELFGALLVEASQYDEHEDDNKLTTHLKQLLEQMLLLSAGKITSFNDPPVFGVDSVAMACLGYLKLCSSLEDTETARHVYQQVLYRSNYGKQSDGKTADEMAAMKEFIDECIRLEARNKKALGRLYNAAIELFRNVDPSVADSFRARRDKDVRYA